VPGLKPLGTTTAGLLALASLPLLGACEDAPTTAPYGASCAAPTVQDPDFQTVTPWSTTGAATLMNGSARFDATAICNGDVLAQTFPSPALGCRQPMVMTLRTSLADDDRILLDVGINDGWIVPAVMLGEQTTTICLGARVLGGSAARRLGAGINPGICPPFEEEGPSFTIEHVSIAVDETTACPPFGTVSNGDFEEGVTSWSLAPEVGSAEISPGVGDGGSFGAHLATTAFCQIPKIAGTMSLPTAEMVPNPALQVWSNGTSNAIASIGMGRAQTYLPGTSHAGKTNICVPRWAQGTVQPLSFGFVETQFTQTCTLENVRDFVFDDLTFVSDPACTANASLFDPGFEQVARAPTSPPFWSLQQYDDEPSARVELKVDPTFAHAGDVAALLSISSACPGAGLMGNVTVPAPVGTAGPALKFWYKTSAITYAGLSATMSALSAVVALPAATDWTQARACLQPNLAGRPDVLTFGVAGSGGDCTTAFTPETFAIDDVELTTDSACPAL